MESQLPYTLVIPTYNRPELLERLLRYLGTGSIPFPIHILDSSNPRNKEANRQACDRPGLDLQIREYPEELPVGEKLLDGFRGVATDFVSFCADDDFVLTEAIRQCVGFLAEHLDYVGCHGTYINFQGPERFHVEYCGPSLDSDSMPARVWRLLRNYEAMNYAVLKTEVYRKILKINADNRFELMFQELVTAVLPLLHGKVERLPDVYYARNGTSGGADQHRKKWHPQLYFLDDPRGLFGEYDRYKTVLLEHLDQEGIGFDPSRFPKWLDFMHAVYFLYNLNSKQVEEQLLEEMGQESQVAAGFPIGPIQAQNRVNPLFLKRAFIELQIYSDTLKGG